MPDPFQNVDAGGAAFVEAVASALETRAAEPVMQAIVARYLADIPCPEGGLHLDLGAGSGAVSRPLARHAANGRIVASDLSPGLIAAARAHADTPANLSFEVADGGRLPQADGSVDTVVMHTLLSHVPDPSPLLAEAARVLRVGGTLAICDCDFSKIAVGNEAGDPLDACAKYFARHFVTDPDLIGKLRGLVAAAGFTIADFRMETRIVTEGLGGLTWVGMGGKAMADAGLIGTPLHEALIVEYHRRIAADCLYGFMPFAVLIARRAG